VSAYGDPDLSAYWLQLRNDGTTLYYDVSWDGANFTNLYSESVGAFITPTAIGFGGVSVIASTTTFIKLIIHNWLEVETRYSRRNVMSTTPNLLISLISSNQASKEVTANSAFVALEAAMTDSAAITMTDADYTFATGAGSLGLSNLVFCFTGPLTTTRNAILPPNAKLYVIKNGTLAGSPAARQPLVFKVGTAATSVTITDANYHFIYSDGVDDVYHLS